MLKIERHRLIETKLKKTGSIIISDISKEIGCSEETIRRDLKEMESNNILQRIHGGAFLPEVDDKGVPIQLREMYFSKTKDSISKYVVKNLINENDSIMLDCSTTCLSLAKNILLSNMNVTIITNSLRIMSLYDEQPQTAKLIAIGGVYRKRSCSFVGYQATKSISNYMADICFISNSAINIKHGLLDNNQNESQVRKAFLEYSNKHYLIADHTKFDDQANYIIAPINTIDKVITNIEPNQKWKNHFESNKIEYIWVE